jgi:K+-sensing histidine kinase KdpD
MTTARFTLRQYCGVTQRGSLGSGTRCSSRIRGRDHGTPPRGEQRQRLEELRRLGTVLGSPLIEVEADDVVEAAARVAADRGTAYMIGQPQPRRGAGRFRESLPDRLLRRIPGVDVRIVADRPGPDQ